MCTILWSKCGWRAGECYARFRSTAAPLSCGEDAVVFVVHANSTIFSSSYSFVTTMHTKPRYNVTKMYFLP